jgi:hypothetical protein
VAAIFAESAALCASILSGPASSVALASTARHAKRTKRNFKTEFIAEQSSPSW